PVFPMQYVLKGTTTALKGSAFCIWCRVADEYYANWHVFIWNPELTLQLGRIFHSNKSGAQALVDCSQEYQHHGGAGIGMPVRNWPADFFLAFGLFVWLVVAAVIDFLAGSNDDVYRCPAHK